MLAAFIIGTFVSGSVIAKITEDTSSALQADKLFNMAKDVSLGRSYTIDDITLSNPDAIIYVFGCSDRPGDADCTFNLISCPTNDMAICVCKRTTDLVTQEQKVDFHGCDTKQTRYPFHGYVRIQSSARIKIEQKDYSGTPSMVIEQVVS